MKKLRTLDKNACIFARKSASCSEENNYDTSIMHGHSGISVYLHQDSFWLSQYKDDIGDDLGGPEKNLYVHQPTAPPSFLGVTSRPKNFTADNKRVQNKMFV
jgi:hypothetical protein